MFKKLLIFLITLFAFLTFASFSFASTLYLSPGSKNIPQGSTVSVNVGINTAGESVNGVSAYLSYPADKLEVAWISYGSIFDIAAEGTYGGSSIKISRGSIAGAVGNVTIATIGFKGKAQGTATVAFVGGSAAPRTSDSSDSLNLGGSTGGVFTVTPPKPEAQKDTEKIVISDVKVSSISTNSATITWQTNEKSDSTVEYGLAPNKYFLTFYDDTFTATHTAKLEGEVLIPGVTFHFRVKSKDENGNERVSGDYVFQLKGFDIKVKILDLDNNPVAETDVYLYTDPQKSRTDLNGETRFANVTPGKHLVVVKLKGNLEKTGEIDVLDSPLSQSFTLTVDTAGAKASKSGLYTILLVVILIIVGKAVLVIWKRRRQNPPVQEPPVQQPSQTWQQPPI